MALLHAAPAPFAAIMSGMAPDSPAARVDPAQP
jgi:hypothetical protein